MITMELKDDRSEKVRYDYSDYPIYIRRGLLSSYPNYAAPSHWHDDIELIAVLSGEMQYNINGEIITLKAQEGVLVNARQIHFGFSEEKKECEFLCVLLHPLLLCTTTAFERDFVLPVLNNRNASFLPLRKKAWEQEIYRQIRTIYSIKKEKSAPIKVQTAFLTIWTLLLDHIPPSESGKKIPNTELTDIKNMVGFIQQNYTEKITLKDIAASGAVGQSKCCALFSKFIGQTPNNYLIQYRLNKSAELLKSSRLSITEIAVAAGFGGGSYYAETFRKWFGMRPTEYRAQIAKHR